MNTEGLKSLLNILPDDEIFNNNNILIFCETFLQKPWTIDGFYAIHALAKSGTEGRPSGGVSCFYNPALGQAKHVESRENTVIAQFKNLQIIAIYIRPQWSADKVVEAIMSALELTDPEIPTQL